MSVFFFFKDTATTEVYPLSRHVALPSYPDQPRPHGRLQIPPRIGEHLHRPRADGANDERRGLHARHPTLADLRRVRLLRSEEHTSELQSRQYVVCRLLLEKKHLGRAVA